MKISHIYILFTVFLCYACGSPEEGEKLAPPQELSHISRTQASYYTQNQAETESTTANGELKDHTKFRAAHATLPFGTLVEITNLVNNKSVIVSINDRLGAYGSSSEEIEIEISEAAARELDMIGKMRVPVEIHVLWYSALKHQSSAPLLPRAISKERIPINKGG